MSPSGSKTVPRAVLLFTTFPVLSETFLQREVTVFSRKGLKMDVVSLWHGNRAWNGIPIQRNGLLTALLSVLWLPLWLVRKPRPILELAGMLWKPRQSGFLNWAENLLGAGYALRTARYWEAAGITHFHGVWASAPAMAAYVLHRLTGIPYSFAGHAYDLYEKGGDGWLREKLAGPDFIRTSTETGRNRLVELGASADDVLLVRRGLPDMPPAPVMEASSPPYRFLSVGRMVEKMGFDQQIPLLAALRHKEIPFTMTWIGDGPERPALESAIEEAGLKDFVQFTGRLSYAAVEKAYQSHDIFLFTGRVDRRGDRAGLPNAVAEAMAWGLLVFATDVGGTSEAVKDGENGFLWTGTPSADSVIYALQEPGIQERCRSHAREWVETHFDLNSNLGPLIARLESVTFTKSAG